MSILYLASSQAMSAVRRRAPNPVSCRVRIDDTLVVLVFALYIVHVNAPGKRLPERVVNGRSS